MRIERATITWQPNPSPEREGVIGYYERVVVFPATPGAFPPAHTGAAPAISLPEAGQEQELILIQRDGTKIFLAFPVDLIGEKHHGIYFVEDNGQNEVTIIPARKCQRVMACYDQYGHIHITIIAEQT